MVYCSATDVQLLTNITVSDISAVDIGLLIAEATKELNSMINVRVTREYVNYIDETRENKINGSNTIYYTRNWKGKYLADRDDDGSVSTTDVVVYLVDQDGVETTATISAVDADDNKITVSTAPTSNDKVYITYEWCYRDPSTPDPLIKLACVYLTAAYCYAKINVGRAPQVKFGNMRIYRHIEAYDKYYQMATKIINDINNKQIDYGESELI